MTAYTSSYLGTGYTLGVNSGTLLQSTLTVPRGALFSLALETVSDNH